jgi:hypothetical protein
MSNINWGTILATSFLFLLITILFYFEEPTENNLVKCYDKFGNEIIGQVCKDTSGFSKSELELGKITFFIAFLIPILLGIALGIGDKINKRKEILK